MSSADQAIVKAIPGNDRCMECGMKSPQWASVSFGTVFCLECSGVHRSLGVHISFVRSIAMDSWTDLQLKAMNCGGNDKCKNYLKSNGVSLSAPIKEKYESRVAQHYKEVLKARINGAPEPPLPAASAAPMRTSNSRNGLSTAVAAKPGEDPNGMERLSSETDEQYVARQTRLRDEARARMAAKFGKSGGMGGFGGAEKKTMSGIGSDSSYNPRTGGYGPGGGSNLDVDSLVSGIGSAFSSLGALGQRGVRNATVAIQDQQSVNQWTGTMKNTGASLWNSLSSAANDIANTITEPDENLFQNDDGLSSLRAHVQLEKRNHHSTAPDKKYEGFGSKNNVTNGNSGMSSANGTIYGGSQLKASNAARLKKEMEKDDFFASFGA